MHTHVESPEASRLPDSPAACRARLAALQDEITSIRLQVAAADMRRQAVHGKPDATAFHRAKTALRLKQQEVTHLKNHLATLEPGAGGAHRDRFKDALIEVVRTEFDETRWASLLGRARALLASREVPHG
jgi:hypothetical protein